MYNHLICGEYQVNLQDYQLAALRTESIVDKLKFNKRFIGLLLKLFAINGEILDAIKKEVYYKNPKKSNETIFANLEKIGELATAAKASFWVERSEADDVDIDPRLFHGIVGMATEAGELVELLLSALEGNKVDATNLHEEMNDSNWYQALLHDAYDLNWEEGLARNIAKLKARYPEKFTVENADNRDLEKERGILEGKNE
jgi:NTP pyrophosphatase (non-canonical NTP hydrolase)